MPERRYYSDRTGKNPKATKFELPIALRLFVDLFRKFESEYYFQEAFGYECIDAGAVPGTLGYDIEAQVFRRLKKPDLWPIANHIESYSEDDLFDIIELLYDQVSAPVKGYEHTYGGCGWHYDTFDKQAGRERYRNEINEILRDYKDGYELSQEGEILGRVCKIRARGAGKPERVVQHSWMRVSHSVWPVVDTA